MTTTTTTSLRSNILDDGEILRRYGFVVRRAALALAAKCGVDADDLWSVGALGLLDAFRRYDSTRGVKLECFVSYRVRGAMLDELRRMDRLPRRLRGRVARLERARAELTQALGRSPSRTELAEQLEVEAGEVDRLEEANEAHRSIDTTPVSAPEVEVDSLIVDKARFAELRSAMQTLSPRHKTALSLRYVEELTLKEIAGILGVSEPRVCQIHNAAVAKLRQVMAPA